MGASQNKGLLPTGNVKDTIEIDGKAVDITICDVANMIIYVDASVASLTGKESAAAINENTAAIATCKEVRGKAAQMLGLCKDWELVDEQSPLLPMVMLMSAYDKDDAADVTGRLILDNRCHDSMAGTGAICLAACTRIPGSVANQKLRKGADTSDTLHVSHPLGVMPVEVSTLR